MKKKMALLLVITIAFTGCGIFKISRKNNIPEIYLHNSTEDNKSSDNNDSINHGTIDYVDLEKEEIKAYIDVCTEHLNECPDGFRATILYLDEDDIYELAIFDGNSNGDGALLYTYGNGEVVPLCNDDFPQLGMYGSFGYVVKGNSFYSEMESTSVDRYHLEFWSFSIVDGELKLNCDLDNVDYFDEAGEVENNEYYVNGDLSTEDEYDSLMDEYYESQNMIIVSYDECEAIKTEDDIEEALSIDYANIFEHNMTLEVELKPVIYLYPNNDNSKITLQLDYDGKLIELDPSFNINNGWNIIADKDGTIRLWDKTYEYLFWEGIPNVTYTINEGFCVKGEETFEFLAESLDTLGLTKNEADEFIEFWLPKMHDNKYNVICFQKEQYTNHARLNVTPEPDTMLRVFMTWYPSDDFVNIPSQTLSTTERTGFTVVEWGGSQIK